MPQLKNRGETTKNIAAALMLKTPLEHHEHCLALFTPQPLAQPRSASPLDTGHQNVSPVDRANQNRRLHNKVI